MTKRAGELTEEEVIPSLLMAKHNVLLQVDRLITIMQNPRQYKIPDWFLNRQKDVKDGRYSQVSVV